MITTYDQDWFPEVSPATAGVDILAKLKAFYPWLSPIPRSSMQIPGQARPSI